MSPTTIAKESPPPITTRLVYHYSTHPVLSQSGFSLENFEREIESITPGATVKYPDGSLEIQVLPAIGELLNDPYFKLFNAAAKSPYASISTGIRHTEYFRIDISVFPQLKTPRVKYQCLLWSPHFVRNKESGLHIPTASPFHGARVSPLENLPLIITFAKKLTEQSRSSFRDCLQLLVEMNQSRQISGERSVQIKSREIRFSTKHAWVYLDASQSGVRTLNWLLMELVFAYRNACLDSIFLTDAVPKYSGQDSQLNPSEIVYSPEASLGPVLHSLPINNP